MTSIQSFEEQQGVQKSRFSVADYDECHYAFLFGDDLIWKLLETFSSHSCLWAVLKVLLLGILLSQIVIHILQQQLLSYHSKNHKWSGYLHTYWLNIDVAYLLYVLKWIAQTENHKLTWLLMLLCCYSTLRQCYQLMTAWCLCHGYMYYTSCGY